MLAWNASTQSRDSHKVPEPLIKTGAIRNDRIWYDIFLSKHSVWISATKWYFDNHTNMKKSFPTTGFEPSLTGQKAAIAASESRRPKEILAKNIVIGFFP